MRKTDIVFLRPSDLFDLLMNIHKEVRKSRKNTDIFFLRPPDLFDLLVNIFKRDQEVKEDDGYCFSPCSLPL